jgi:BirA family biotin operon repressor/biotin-[acetyl-CoA-carboxylase] ligase
MEPRDRLLRLLRDGRFHSGQDLGAALGVGRAAVWKAVQGLTAQGLQVEAVRGRGYRLAEPVTLLSAQAIQAGLPPELRDAVASLEVRTSVDSTNRRLLERGGDPAGLQVLIAEHQSAGRGRRGRTWQSPLAANLYLSCLWRVARPPVAVAAFSLVAGLVVARAAADLGVPQARVKWPNDVWWEGRKLAGVLLEMSGEPAGPCDLVVGIGVNVNMRPGQGPPIGQPWASLREALGVPVDRNRLASALVAGLVEATRGFEAGGLGPFLAEYRRRDLLAGRRVTVHLAAEEGDGVEGEALGVDEQGAFRLRAADGERRFHSGEVTVRPAP